MTDFGLLTIAWFAALVLSIVRRWRAKTEREEQIYGVAWVLAAIPLCGYIVSAILLDPVPHLPIVPGRQFVVRDETGKPMSGVAVDVEWKVLPLTIDFLPPRITPRTSDGDDVSSLFADSREGTLRAGFHELVTDDKGRVVVSGAVKPFPPLLFVVGGNTFFGIRYNLHAGMSIRVYADGYLANEFGVDRAVGPETVILRRPFNVDQWERTLADQVRGGVREQGDRRFVQYLCQEIVRFVDSHPTSIEADALLSEAAGLNKKINREEKSLRLYRRVVERNRDRFLVRQAIRELEIPWFNEMARRDTERLRRDLEVYYQTAGWPGSPQGNPRPKLQVTSVKPPPTEPCEDQNVIDPASILGRRPPATYAMVQHEQHYRGMIQILDRLGRQWDPIAWDDDAALFERNPVILVPSGAVIDMPDRERIRSIVERHVKRGGVLAIFDQRYGGDFALAPRPPGGRLGGLGWRENDLDPPKETVMDAVHPITAGLSSWTPDVSIDGYFTEYPSTATVLLRQRTTNKPAMILYPYGNGWVILCTCSPEWSAMQKRISRDELTVMENLLTWIEVRGQTMAKD